MRVHLLLVLAMVTLFGLVSRALEKAFTNTDYNFQTNSEAIGTREIQAAQKDHHAHIIASKAAADAELFPGYDIHTYTWTFDVHPGTGNDNASFNGTIEHAMAQMNET